MLLWALRVIFIVGVVAVAAAVVVAVAFHTIPLLHF